MWIVALFEHSLRTKPSGKWKGEGEGEVDAASYVDLSS